MSFLNKSVIEFLLNFWQPKEVSIFLSSSKSEVVSSIFNFTMISISFVFWVHQCPRFHQKNSERERERERARERDDHQFTVVPGTILRKKERKRKKQERNNWGRRRHKREREREIDRERERERERGVWVHIWVQETILRKGNWEVSEKGRTIKQESKENKTS